jgi:hypothetical protein
MDVVVALPTIEIVHNLERKNCKCQHESLVRKHSNRRCPLFIMRLTSTMDKGRRLAASQMKDFGPARQQYCDNKPIVEDLHNAIDPLETWRCVLLMADLRWSKSAIFRCPGC